MSIEYKELKTEEDFYQCIDLQRSIFGFSDTDLISPLFLRLIARNSPPLGISIGVYNSLNDNSEMVGYLIGFATFLEKSMYTVLMGIKPEYQNKGFGYKLSLKSRELAVSKGINHMYCVFDTLESSLARLYISSLGFVGIEYEKELRPNNTKDEALYIPKDKLLAKWDFHSEKTLFKLNNLKINVDKVEIGTYPVANEEYMPDVLNVLIEIPENFIELKKHNFEAALKWRESTRKIFSEYINNRQYVVSDCYSIKSKEKRKTYYLLEKQKC